VTQGRVEYESTIPQITDEGLDLWEATRVKVPSGFCFRQQGKSKVGEHSFYREHDIQLKEHISPDDEESCLFTLGTNSTT